MSAPVRVHEGLCLDSLQKQFFWEDDFLGDSIADEWFTWGTGGRGSTVVVDGQTGGIVRLTTGTTIADIRGLDWSTPFRILLTSKNVALEVRAKLNTVVSGSDAYRFGLMYDWANYLDFFLNAGVWYAQQYLAGAQTLQATTLTYDTNWHIFRIETSATAIKYYGDDVLLQTLTTNIPTNYLYLWMLAYTGVAVAKSVDVDYVAVRQDR